MRRHQTFSCVNIRYNIQFVDMKNSVKYVIIIIFLINCKISNAYFSNTDAGVRPVGMGGAFVGLADDVNAIRWNSAGLAQLSKRELTVSYSALYLGLNAKLYTGETDRLAQHFIAYTHPIGNIDTVGVSWLFFNSTIYDENIFTLNYARQIASELYGGLGLKVLNFGITPNQYAKISSVLSSTALSHTEITADLSCLYNFTSNLSIGLSLKNVYPVYMGIISKKRVPLEIRTGVVYKLENTYQSIDLAFRNHRLNGRREYKLMIGIEHWLLDKTVGIRAGYNTNSASLGMSYCYGAKYQIWFDYAFIYPILSIKETSGSHKFAISLKF